MIYLIPAVTTSMLAYMVWRLVFRLRADRIRAVRHSSRGKFAFRRRERVRFLLNRAFHVADDKPEWEDPLVSSLAKIPPPKRDTHDKV